VVVDVECDPNPEGSANARLIAAAPELLEALEVILIIASPPYHERALVAILDASRNAIAKAKGETK
jgi:hypothetical protein